MQVFCMKCKLQNLDKTVLSQLNVRKAAPSAALRLMESSMFWTPGYQLQHRRLPNALNLWTTGAGRCNHGHRRLRFGCRKRCNFNLVIKGRNVFDYPGLPSKGVFFNLQRSRINAQDHSSSLFFAP